MAGRGVMCTCAGLPAAEPARSLTTVVHAARTPPTMPQTYRPSFHQQAEQEVEQEEEGPAQVAQVEEHECEEQHCEVGTALLQHRRWVA